MIKQSVFIINFNSLYEILDEIKENLSFKIIKIDNENNLLKIPNVDKINSLIILNPNQTSLANKDISKKNLFNSNKFPLNLNKLLELINIRLIKLKFNQQSKINIKDYELNLNSKFLSKNDLSLKLTEKEIEIILYLNETKTKKDVSNLQKYIWDYSLDMETHTVETHIYRLRKKISNKFNDKSFILSDKKGYFIDLNETNLI
tara:strand:+ start:194 stop:802 length:609 start_codon:yes stop_codon:yes gene_type:complete